MSASAAGRAAGARLGMAAFWLSSMSVGAAAFVVLAVLARTGAAGDLGEASVVIGVSFVLAVVPGAIQLRGTARAASGAPHGELPVRFVIGSTLALAIVLPALAAGLGVPAAALLLLAPQYLAACVASAQRGRAIGRAEHRHASESMGIEAAVRLAAGIALGALAGPTGLALALLLGSGAAAAAGRRWAGPLHRAPAAAVAGPALSVGLLMVLVNLDALAAPRLLGPAGADAYALAELPARGVFFALFAASWLAVPRATRAVTRGDLLAPALALAAVGAAASLSLLVVRPLLPLALGDPAPAPLLLATLAAAMTLAAVLATALAMAVARTATAPWAPTLLACAGLAGALGAGPRTAESLAGLVLIAVAAALAGTLILLLRTVPGRERAPAGPPAPAPR